MKNIPYKSVLITILSFLACYIGLYYLIAKPRIAIFRSRYKALTQIQAQLAELLAKKEALLKLQKDEKRIDNALNLAQNLIPKNKATSDFLIQIETAVTDTGNDMKSITVNESPKKTKSREEEESQTKNQKKEAQTEEQSPYKTITFSINMEGNWKQLLDFLVLTESLSRLAILSNITIMPLQNNLLQTKVNGEIYYK